MQLITSNKIISKYGSDIIDNIKQISENIHIFNDGVKQEEVYNYIQTSCEKIFLIVGGPDIIPFMNIKNPVNDKDKYIESDGAYTASAPDYLYSEKIISRIPDEQNNWNKDFFIKILNNSRSTTTKKQFGINYCALRWDRISKYLQNKFNFKIYLTSPSQENNKLKNNNIHDCYISHINLHGKKNVSNYFGQDENGFPIALSISDIISANGSIYYIECCYGGQLSNKNKLNSIPLHLLGLGADAIICSTSISYGPVFPPPSQSDLLGEIFYSKIVKNSVSLGNLFFESKKQFLIETINRFGMVGPEDKKTILQFNIYGNPEKIIEIKKDGD